MNRNDKKYETKSTNSMERTKIVSFVFITGNVVILLELARILSRDEEGMKINWSSFLLHISVAVLQFIPFISPT